MQAILECRNTPTEVLNSKSVQCLMTRCMCPLVSIAPAAKEGVMDKKEETHAKDKACYDQQDKDLPELQQRPCQAQIISSGQIVIPSASYMCRTV